MPLRLPMLRQRRREDYTSLDLDTPSIGSPRPSFLVSSLSWPSTSLDLTCSEPPLLEALPVMAPLLSAMAPPRLPMVPPPPPTLPPPPAMTLPPPATPPPPTLPPPPA